MTPIIGSPDLSPQPARSLVDSFGAPLFVGGVWVIMTLSALLLVLKFGCNSPHGDEWAYVSYLTGEQPVTAELLWAQHAEHRIPLPKAIHLVLSRLTNCDYRAGMVLNVITLAALAFAMIRVAKRLRGSSSYADAFFPLALLQLAQIDNLLWSFQVAFVLSTMLAGIFLLIIVRHPTQLDLRSAVLAGTCLVLLPLFGAQGLSLVPCLALWLGSSALLHLAKGTLQAKGASVVMLTLSILSALMIALYFHGYHRHPYFPACPSLRAGLRTTVEFMIASFGINLSFGTNAAWFWPNAGWAMISLLLITCALLIVSWWSRPQEWFRILGLLAFLGAMISLSLAVGWGRSGFGPGAGFLSRYVTIAIPWLCCVYFIWELYAVRPLRHLGQMILFALVCAMTGLSTVTSLEDAKARRDFSRAMERDLRRGVPISVFVDCYVGRNDVGRNLIFPPGVVSKELATRGLMELHRANVGSFRYLRSDLPLREVSVPVVPSGLNQITWDKGVGRGTGVDPYLVFALKRPEHVYGIKLKYVVHHDKKTAPLRVFWKRGDRNEFSAAERNVLVNVETGGENTTTIPVNDTIDHYRIDLEDPTSAIRISEIVLRLPPTGSEVEGDRVVRKELGR